MMFCSAVSLQLEGSELLENQSEMFSGKTKAIKSKASVRFLKLVQMFFHFWLPAIMTNCMTWNMHDPEPFLEVDVSLKVTLEVVYCFFFFRLFIVSFSCSPLLSVALRVLYTKLGLCILMNFTSAAQTTSLVHGRSQHDHSLCFQYQLLRLLGICK